MNNHYILDESNRVIQADLMTWATWFHEFGKRRQVARETVEQSDVSTVFLGLDHNFEDGGPPVLWETMVFGGVLDEQQDRCSGTWEQAKAMHARMIERVRQAGTTPA